MHKSGSFLFLINSAGGDASTNEFGTKCDHFLCQHLCPGQSSVNFKLGYHITVSSLACDRRRSVGIAFFIIGLLELFIERKQYYSRIPRHWHSSPCSQSVSSTSCGFTAQVVLSMTSRFPLTTVLPCGAWCFSCFKWCPLRAWFTSLSGRTVLTILCSEFR